MIADDDPSVRMALEHVIGSWHPNIESFADGVSAWHALQSIDEPCVALVDWIMPGLAGLEICAMLRDQPPAHPVHMVLLTSKGRIDDIVEGLEAGADDYVVKPFHKDELKARLRAAFRMLDVQVHLAHKIRELEDAFAQVRALEGLLPICSYCKRIRDDNNYWTKVEDYLSSRSSINFSHGVCPACFERHVEPDLKKLREERDGSRSLPDSPPGP